MAKATTAKAGRGGDEGASEIPKVAGEKVKASTTDTQIVKMDTEGKDLVWSFEDFRVLEGSVLDELGRRNLDRYFVELGAYRRRLAREKDEAEYGKFPTIEVLGRSAAVRMEVQGLPSYLHPYWADPEEVAARKRAGYVTVDVDRFPEVTAGDSVTGNQRKYKNERERTEAILMAVPVDRYDDHLQGQSQGSRANLQAQNEKSRDEIIKAAGTASVDPKFREEAPVKIKVPRGS